MGQYFQAMKSKKVVESNVGWIKTWTNKKY